MGVEIRDSDVDEEAFDRVESFVRSYLTASVEREEEGGRMRWYPWHSGVYRFNHILNVAELAADIAEREGGDVDVVRMAALFHDIAKLEAEQDEHATEGARIAREYMESREFSSTFIDQVCRAVAEHSHQGPLSAVSVDTRCLIEADVLDKIGANGAVLMLLRMGYEARPHVDAVEMIDRVLERGRAATERIESDTAESVAHKRMKRVKWLREWLEEEVPEMRAEPAAED